MVNTMDKINMRYVMYIVTAVWYVSFMVTYGLLMIGCSNGGIGKDKKADKEVPLFPDSKTIIVSIPVKIEVPEGYQERECATCYYTIEEIQASLSACKAARKKDHVLCVYDYLFDNHLPEEAE